MYPIDMQFVCALQVELGPVTEMGEGRGATRRIVPIIGGKFEGPLLKGKVLSVGADWQSVYTDGLAFLDTRYALQTDDGAVIEIINQGFRHGPQGVLARLVAGEDVDSSLYYMRTCARLETGDPRYDWVNRHIFVGRGKRLANAVKVELFQLL
ncbi:MAG: DUF3237 domain-containing protein [Gammaproteobacteria bacterium]|nr:DUF3237 domain-containing protein [Gammaproteobacteria bacterium]